MTFNPFKPLIQDIKEFFLDNAYKDNERNDQELECLQFGICAVQVESPRSEELFFR